MFANIAATAASIPTVLVIDDQSMIRLLCRKYLQHCGFTILEADSGEKGLELCESLIPDIILLDVSMPDMDGYQVCEALREQARFKITPIIMLTGHDDLPSIQKAFDSGATDFVTKPVNWLILSHRLRYMIRAASVLTQLQASQNRLGAAQRIAHIGNWEYDADSNEMYWSDEVFRILGRRPGELTPSLESIYALIPETVVEEVKKTINTALTQLQSITFEHPIHIHNNKERIIQQKIQICQDHKTHHLIATATLQDVTKQRRSEEKIRYMAHYDDLTGLPNRASFKQLLDNHCEDASDKSQLMAVLFIDIDRFKQVNDSLGHDVGDALLQAVALRIQDCVRHVDVVSHGKSTDGHCVARFGGDEFTVLLDNLHTPVDAAKTAKRLITAFAEPIQIGEHALITSPSIGISIFPNDEKTPDGLLKFADMAMYYAKNRGRNNFVFYSESMNTHALERFNLESSLQKAINNGEMVVYYQPKMNIQNRTIHGFEALVRWQHPDLGTVLPQDFIPLAEETNLINDIGVTVLTAACKQMKSWLDQGYALEKMSVNLSPKQFLDHNLIATIAHILLTSGLPSEYLEIEVTESIFMESTDDIISAMQAIKKLGVDIALDDFGTGFSSLSYLKRFPIDTLKIDKTFLKDMETDSDNVAITKSIIAMARCLRLGVVAEGVETEIQCRLLVELGCNIAQGYFFSRPEPADIISTFMDEYLSAPMVDAP